MENAQRINVYTCEKCQGRTVTIDVDEGVTPFQIDCRASGTIGDCDGPAYSCFYSPVPSAPTPAWEWFKPTGAEYAKLSRAMKQYVDNGGLDIRARMQVAA